MKNDSGMAKGAVDCGMNVKAHDDRHRELLGIHDRLSNAIGAQQDRRAVLEALDALLRFVETHLTAEEQEMRAAEYGDFEAHVMEHTRLLEQLDLFFHKHSLEGMAIHFEIQSFLKEWINDHILGSDRKYFLTLSPSPVAAAN